MVSIHLAIGVLHDWMGVLTPGFTTLSSHMPLQCILAMRRLTRQARACAGERHREGVLQGIAVNLEDWTVQVKREKAIYHTLNKLSVDTSRKVGDLVDLICLFTHLGCR